MAAEAPLEAGDSAAFYYTMKISRFFKHLFLNRWLVRFYFSKKDLDKISEQIALSEDQHRAEIRFAVEANLGVLSIVRGAVGRQRGIDVFSQLRIWDTEENNGVLIYLLLADHDIEIIADRGIHQSLGHDYWEKINAEMVEYFKKKQYAEGILYGIKKITEEMVRLFPKQGEDPNELSNEVVVL